MSTAAASPPRWRRYPSSTILENFAKKALEKISQQYAGKLTVATVNIDDEEALARQEQIEVIPTLVIYENGEALGSIVAPDSKARIEEFIEETLGV